MKNLKKFENFSDSTNEELNIKHLALGALLFIGACGNTYTDKYGKERNIKDIVGKKIEAKVMDVYHHNRVAYPPSSEYEYVTLRDSSGNEFEIRNYDEEAFVEIGDTVIMEYDTTKGMFHGQSFMKVFKKKN